MSRLEFPLDSCWHGLELGIREPEWGIHVQWLTPIQRDIRGDLADYDWQIPDAEFTDLGYARQRWIEGQMVDLAFEFQAVATAIEVPVEVWPMVGFRWQRFDIMAYDAIQVKADDIWLDPPDSYPGDVLTLNQQYYFIYVGGQLRARLETAGVRPVELTFQGDWGYVGGYNIDHHLIREGDRYTMESTNGESWHIAFIAEMPVGEHLSLGVQVDHLELRTVGTHHWVNVPLHIDESWKNGVSVSSDQTMITAFARWRI